MFADQACDRVVHRFPMGMCCKRAEFGAGCDYRKVEFAASVIGAHNPDRARRAFAVRTHLGPGEKRSERNGRSSMNGGAF